MTVTVDSADAQPVTTEDGICFTTGSAGLGLASFCGGGAEEARGTITRVFYFPGSNGSMCGDDNNVLISNQGSSLPPSCSGEIPRL
jgi:hypothetical protein